VLGLSGTPLPHGPLDIFGQARAIVPGLYGRSYFKFFNRYADRGRFGAYDVKNYKNLDELSAKMATFRHRARKSECLDLPPVSHRRVHVELCPKARRAYDSLDKLLRADIGIGTVTAANGLVRLLRLAQLTSGTAVYEDARDGERRNEIIDTAKREALEEILDDTDKPVVVFGRFKCDLRVMRAVVEERSELYSEVSGAANDLAAWKADPMRRVLGVQIKAGGLGLDFTKAHDCVFLSVGFDMGDYEQALARVDRPGQTVPVTYYHVVARDTVDLIEYGALGKKKRLVDAVLGELSDTTTRRTG
jgi:SNF2 family DNA or RNA helicase